MLATARKYHAGETDAIVRRLRGYLRLIDDDETPNDRKKYLSVVVTEDFRALDEFLSSGQPLPSQWMNGREVVQVAGQAGEASTEEVSSEKEET